MVNIKVPVSAEGLYTPYPGRRQMDKQTCEKERGWGSKLSYQELLW